MIALNLKGDISQKFPGKTHNLGLGRSKVKAAHPVDYFLGKILLIGHPLNSSYLPSYNTLAVNSQ